MQGGQPLDHRLVRHCGSGDQDIDVAGGRVEAPQGQRPTQIQAGQPVPRASPSASRRPSTTPFTSSQGVDQE
jgi:hypothetical protein